MRIPGRQDDAASGRIRREGADEARKLRRWPWILGLLLIAAGSMVGRAHLATHRDAVAHGAWEAATFAQATQATVHALTILGAAVPPEDWRRAVGPLLADRDQAARAQLILLRELAGRDRRLRTLDAELSAIKRDLQGAGTDPTAERRVMGRALRLGRVAGSIARDLRAREAALGRTILAWQAAILVATAALMLVLFRAFRRVLLREAAAHATHLRHLADHDALTGLGNRRKLERDLHGAIAGATSERPLQVLVCDLDGFKAYNDASGHAAGDALLARVAGRMAAAAGPHGAAYRLGGDEFCVLWRGDGDLRPQLVRALADDAEAAGVRGSVGAVVVPREASDGSAALRLADARMYDEKATGRAGNPGLVLGRAA